MRFFIAIVFAFWTTSLVADVTVGVVAPQGPEKAQERWKPFTDMLADRLGEPVSLFPVSPQDGTMAFLNGHVDFLLGNPVQSAVIKDTMNAVPVASMVGTSGSQFAGVIAVRADSQIQQISDLRGVSFASLGDWAAGGYLFQAAYIMENGFPRPDEMADRVRGANQDQLVRMVLDGTVDAAFIRTGIIEGLVAAGELEPGALRVIADKKSGPDDLHRTTRWFPQWYMMGQGTISSEMHGAMTGALLELEASDPIAQHARIVGFEAPSDVGPVVEAMQRVGVTPYN